MDRTVYSRDIIKRAKHASQDLMAMQNVNLQLVQFTLVIRPVSKRPFVSVRRTRCAVHYPLVACRPAIIEETSAITTITRLCVAALPRRCDTGE